MSITTIPSQEFRWFTEGVRHLGVINTGSFRSKLTEIDLMMLEGFSLDMSVFYIQSSSSKRKAIFQLVEKGESGNLIYQCRFIYEGNGEYHKNAKLAERIKIEVSDDYPKMESST